MAMTTAEAVSFALGAASILLGLLAIWLSVHFYTRDQALFVETQRTLADIQRTARSVEHATEHVLARAIDYLAGRPAGVEPDDRLGEAVDREFARAVRSASSGGVAPQLTPQALEELRRAIEQIIAAHEERRREEDKQRAFWSGTLGETQEALAQLRASEESAVHNDRRTAS
jgi:hypothetical protein